MTQALIPAPPVEMAAYQALIEKGDISKLSPKERVQYYGAVCASLGLNPLTQPFDYLELSGKTVLYATRKAGDQLRKINGVSITSLEKVFQGDIYLVTANAVDKTGRTDSSTGAVYIKGLSGLDYANALMRCETKAKRRVTLSLCGLGWLDESEIETIPGARPFNVDLETGEVLEPETYVPTREREVVDAKPATTRQERLLREYRALLAEARSAQVVTDASPWVLRSDASEAEIIDQGRQLRALVNKHVLKTAKPQTDEPDPDA
jgi:hypothetical protein